MIALTLMSVPADVTVAISMLTALTQAAVTLVSAKADLLVMAGVALIWMSVTLDLTSATRWQFAVTIRDHTNAPAHVVMKETALFALLKTNVTLVFTPAMNTPLVQT